MVEYAVFLNITKFGGIRLENKKTLSYKAVVSLAFLVYFFSYAMRLDYAASLVAIVSDLNISNTEASIAVTGSFITYGLGQVICGFIGDKISPIKMINIAMIGTILLNILVSFCSNIVLITVLWCINGVCQAMLWPPLTRFVLELVGVNSYSDAITIVGLSGSVGTIFVYLFVPLVLEFTIWRNVFRCMSLFGIVMILIWYFSTKKINMGKAEAEKVGSSEKKISVWGLITLAGLIPIFVVIVLQGILRDGIQTWLPSIVREQFGLSESSSILSTAILPVLSMLSVLFANLVYHKVKNELKTSAIMFIISFVATIPLLFSNIPAIVTIVAAALISGCMHGINLMLISFIPKTFMKYGMVATFSGILNAFTYVGAALSTYGFAAIADGIGWNAVIYSWCVIAFIATVICILKIKSWKEFAKNRWSL